MKHDKKVKLLSAVCIIFLFALLFTLSLFSEFSPYKLHHTMPDIINFLHIVHKTRTGPLVFVSPNTHLLHKLYNKLYPQNKSYYVYSSHKILENGSPEYVKYITPFVRMNSNWVDTYDTNKSHVHFFTKHFGHVPKKYLFLYLPRKPKYKKNLWYYTSSLEFKNWFPAHIKEIFTPYYKHLVDVKLDGQVVFDEKKTSWHFKKYGRHLKRLKKDYKEYEKMVHPNMFLFNEKKLLQPCVTEPDINSQVRGVLALDVDGTLKCDEYWDKIRQTVQRAKHLRYKVVIITSKSCALHIPWGRMGVSEGLNIYYNATQKNIPKTKAKQLKHAHHLAGLSKHYTRNSYLFDDQTKILKAVEKAGFSALHVTCNTIGPYLVDKIAKKITI